MIRAEAQLPLYLVLLLLIVGAACTTLKRLGYEGWNRDEWQYPLRVVEALGIREGGQVADIGSGSGYFTFRLAKPVGPGGTVFAVDLDAEMNDHVRQEARVRGQGNVRVITAKPEDPLLPEAGVDLIFSCNTYHHIQNRARYFRRVRRCLRPGGRVAIVDFDDSHWIPRLLGHWVQRDQILAEMTEAGYYLAREFNFLPRQHFLIFETSE